MNKKLWLLLLPFCITACVDDYYEESVYSTPYRQGHYNPPQAVSPEPYYDPSYNGRGRAYQRPYSRNDANNYRRPYSRTNSRYSANQYPNGNEGYQRPMGSHDAPR